MGNPLYGQNKADGQVGWLQNHKVTKAHGALGDNLTLTAANMIDCLAITADPAAARNITTPTAALVVAAIKVRADDGKCEIGDSFTFSFINIGTAGVDETCTMVAGTGFTLIGFADVENPVTTHDAFSAGSSLWAVQVTNNISGSEACDIIRLA
jgi:hypothetical protein